MPGDPADSPRASTSHTPADAADSLKDFLAEPLLLARLAEPRMSGGAVLVGDNGVQYDPLSRARVQQLVAAQIASAGLDERDGSFAREAEDPDVHARFVAAMMAEVHAFRDPYLAFRCLPIVFNLPVGNETEQALADEFGFQRATVSNLCVHMRRELKVPPGRGMRKEAICQKYSARQTGVRARPKASPWPFSGMLARVKTSLAA